MTSACDRDVTRPRVSARRAGGDRRRVAHEESPRPERVGAGVGDADARGRQRSRAARSARRVEDHDRARDEIAAVQRAVDAHGATEVRRVRAPARPRQRRRGSPRRRRISGTPASGSSARSRTASGTPARARHDVAAVVHAVREVDVEAAGGPHITSFRGGAPAAGGVRGAILGPAVRLDLDDAARGDAVRGRRWTRILPSRARATRNVGRR